MDAKTEYGFDYERLMLVCGGHIFFQTLAAAIELNVFPALEKRPMTRKELAKELGLEEKPLRILLLGLTSLKLVNKDNDIFSNTELGKMFFLPESPRSFVNIIKWQNKINYKAMFHFADAIKANANVGLQEFKGTEPTLYERLVHTPHLETIFQDAMAEISAQSNKNFADLANLSGIKFLLDVGGGNGSNIINLAKRHKDIKFAVFDSPTVCKKAEANFEKNPDVKSRLSTFKGNCFKDPFPKEVDAILFCHFFTIWSEDENKALLKKCFDTLPSGGKALIFNMMQTDAEDGPLSAALGSPYFLTLATGRGMLYTRKEYKDWFSEVGFKNVTEQNLPFDHAVIIGTKP